MRIESIDFDRIMYFHAPLMPSLSIDKQNSFPKRLAFYIDAFRNRVLMFSQKLHKELLKPYFSVFPRTELTGINLFDLW
jgi:hypothetical protein